MSKSFTSTPIWVGQLSRPSWVDISTSNGSLTVYIACEQYETQCACNNPHQRPKAGPGVQSIEGALLENVVLDFTELPWAQGYK